MKKQPVNPAALMAQIEAAKSREDLNNLLRIVQNEANGLTGEGRAMLKQQIVRKAERFGKCQKPDGTFV